MTKAPKDEEHAKYGASKAERWLNCPASIALAEKAPPQPPSKYADEGTQAHKCLDFLLKNRKKRRAALAIASKRWNPEMVAHAENTLDWVEEQLSASPGAVLLSETRVDSSHFTTEGQFGTLDIAIVREFDRLTIVDYKFGAGVAVDPGGHDGHGNAQLVYYGLALSASYGHNFTDVELVIDQPRAFHESGEKRRSMVLGMERFLAWEYEFKAGVAVCEQESPPIRAGPWCKFCPAAVICPELKDASLKKAQAVFDDEKGLISTTPPTAVKPKNFGTVLDACDRLEDWIGKFREYAFHYMNGGGRVAGFKLVEKRAQRKWTDENIATGEARKRFGAVAFSSPELLSPAQLEKMAKDVPGTFDWVKARVTAESSGLTIARDSDKRPASRSIEDIFPDIPAPAVMQGRLPAAKKTKKVK